MSVALLLSGGMDSTAIAAWKKPDIAFTIDYGQVAALGEIRAASQIARELGIYHEVLSIDARFLGSGDMAGEAPSNVAPVSEWWPFRNQFLVTIAAMRGIALNVNTILMGSVSTDRIHSDGSHEFYKALATLVFLQEGNIQITAPGLEMSTSELVRKSSLKNSVLFWTHSCHKSQFSCGRCRGCMKRQSVLEELGLS